MRVRDRPETLAAMLLVGLAALNALIGAAGGAPRLGTPVAAAPQPLPALGSSARKDMDWCLRNVSIVHDVYWASACAVDAQQQRARRAACLLAHPAGDASCGTGLEPPDDSSDCTLPDARARDLNAARARAEQQCFDEARAR
jgi:hypothetical protein